MFKFFRYKNTQLKNKSYEESEKTVQRQKTHNIDPTTLTQIQEYATEYATTLIIINLNASKFCTYDIQEQENAIHLTSSNDTYVSFIKIITFFRF